MFYVDIRTVPVFVVSITAEVTVFQEMRAKCRLMDRPQKLSVR